MKRGFSLIEILLAILLISIMVTVAIPKFGGMVTNAKATSVKQDINTIITSVRNYYALHQETPVLNEIVTLDSNIWEISNDSAVFKDKDVECVNITISDSDIDIVISDSNNGDICTKIREHFSSQTISLE